MSKKDFDYSLSRMTETELNKIGWWPWYNQDYYVNRKMPELVGVKKDHTYLGLSRAEAIKFETDDSFRAKIIDAMKTVSSAEKWLSGLGC